MLAVGIKLNHAVVAMVDSISSRSLKTNSQTTINWHGDNVAVQRTTNFARSVARPVINNNKVKFRRNSPKLCNSIFNTLFFIVCRNCNKSFYLIRQSPTSV